MTDRTRTGRRLGALKLGAAMIAGAWGCGAAYAQAPNQTPPGATAVEPSPPPRIAFPPAQGLAAPAGAEDIHFALSGYNIEGQFAELEAASHDLAADQIGRTISVADVYGFAGRLQQSYFAAGFPLARVVVPPQELGASGAVRILVVDGFVEALDTAHVPERARRHVEHMLAPLVGLRHPTRTQIERRLLLAGDTAGLALSSSLTPGAAVGATVLVLNATHDAAASVVAVDNRVSRELGRSQITASVAFNSVLGHGERAYVTAASHGSDLSDDALRRYFGIGFETPVGDDGLSLGLSADYSSTRPRGDVANQELASEYSRVGVAASYPLVRSRAGNLTIRGAFDFADDIQRTNLAGPPATTLSADRIRVLRVAFEGEANMRADAHANFNLGVSQGLDMMGARGRRDATLLKPLSRQGADASFTALDAAGGFASPAPFRTDVSFTARGRYGFDDPLLRSEQFSPAGSDGLSGPPPGLLVGDAGGVARAEIQRAFLDVNAVFAPYAFVAGASVRLEQPTVLELPHTDASGYGLGLRMGFGRRERGGYQFTGAVEWSRINSNDPDLDRSWTGVTVATRF